MSNLDTTGYTRQQVLQSDVGYNTLSFNPKAISNQQTGLGVSYSKVRQVRDDFLDQAYRREAGRSAFYDTSYQCALHVQTLLGEVYEAKFNESMENFKLAMDELAKTPNDSVVQGLVIQRASAFLNNAQSVYQGLSDYQDNLNLQVKTSVDKINSYGQKLHDLNTAIVRVEAGGVESANDLRDERNKLLDELGSLAKISYKEDMYGNVRVQLEGHDFVSRDLVYEIGLQEDAVTGFFTPFWVVDADYTVGYNGKKTYDTEGAEVFNLQVACSTEFNTDIGGLKALLLMRGDKRANYTDVQDADKFNKDISPSIMMTMQAEFDQLIHQMTTTMNGILAEAADPATGYLCEKVMVDGKETYRPIQLFQKRFNDGYTYDRNAEEWVYSEEKASDSETLYSTMNLIINQDLVREPTRLSLRGQDGKGDYKTAAALAEAFQREPDNFHLNPNVKTPANFIDYYSDMVGQLGLWGSIFGSYSENQTATLEATCSAREQIVGVSSDEELTNMIKFQNAYNASSRYINVVNEMLEHLLNSLAG